MIIKSLLDTDLYKFTMMQVALHRFSKLNVKYSFKCRNNIEFTVSDAEAIDREIDHLCTLMLHEDEIKYLGTLGYFKESFLDFLRIFKMNRKHISVSLCGDELMIDITGPWYLTILFEVPVLAIVSEVYNKSQRRYDNTILSGGAIKLLNKKIFLNKIGGIPFNDFGTRRRYSFDWHEEVIGVLKNTPGFSGTSNLYMSKKYNLPVIGTMAHEFFMVGQALENVSLQNSQRHQLQVWAEEYRGDLGIALTDTLGTKSFLKDFDLYFANLYRGVRHDSGDPFEWGEKIIEHYEKLGIDTSNKVMVFSDGLDLEMANKIYNRFSDRINVSFGIGTNLTNDIPGNTPLQIVIKIIEVDGNSVAKISDSKGKVMCNDEEFFSYLYKVK